MSFFVIAFLIIAIDILTVFGIRKILPKFNSRHSQKIRIAFVIQVILSLIIVLGGFFLKDHTRNYRLFAIYYYLFGFMLTVYLPKCLFIVSYIVDLLIWMIFNRKRRTQSSHSRESYHLSAKCGLFLSFVCMCFFIWGIFVGRYNYTVERVEIAFADLPEKFDGYRIAQISDIHAGSFAGTTNRLRKAADMINAQNPNIIVFTGDLVNNFAEEVYPLIPIFSKLEASDGKYASLGNHDYGIYYQWDTPEEQEENHRNLEQAIIAMGFKILNNEAVIVSKDSLNRIAIVGVENWGIAERYPKKGDIGKATVNVRDIPFKVLLSHDPSFWTEKISGKTDIQLTLSGHTHGMQMGVKLGNEYYSPARLRYRRWAGLYHGESQYLYINRGLGVIGFPGRIGMPPEITVIDLKRGK